MAKRSILETWLLSFLGAMLTAGLSSAQTLPHVWSRSFGDASTQFGRCITVADNGDVILAGYFEGSINFGGGVLTSAGGLDALVASFTASGSHRWSKLFGDASDQYGIAVVLQMGVWDEPVVTGQFSGTIDLGGGPLVSHGDTDIFLARFDHDGTYLWSRSFGGTQRDVPGGVSGKALGTIALTGAFRGTCDFGGGPLTALGENDVFVATYDEYGQHLTSQRHGSANFDSGYDICVGPSDEVAAVGSFRATINSSGGELTSAGGYDVFVVKFGSFAAVPDAPGPTARDVLRPIFDPRSHAVHIPYSLSQGGRVRLDVHDLQGRLLKTLIDAVQPAGPHEVTWNVPPRGGSPAPTGIHFVRLTTQGEVQVGKLVVMH